ncbi:helix-turn-helix transcriptional regulator [Streptomyces sp. B1866]|uniref:AraC family transcriptional regulator n=1 Tax=Streptomyces sp. B1866 TaxID=3075431 RepID=UPI00288CB950|nr:helix-turn-helix transcriptional regulator [Streptomyces sp. B1866]MDT3397459.1 helix-turn-helix transcriptional regulator [Streptomyces sp. B1866]
MSPIRQPACKPVEGPSRVPLADRERIDWHFHTHGQLISPGRGVLRISTAAGAWIVPPQRAVWIPARVPHAHQAHGPTELRALVFPASADPLGGGQPAVLAVPPLLREVIAALTGDPGLPPAHRRNLERVALDQLRRVEALRLCLPYPADPRLRDVAAILQDDPADCRTLAQLGAAVGAAERTLSRLFRAETGMTFPQWRTQLRLHHSLTLLASGASVTTAAAACGYSGPSAFIQAFRAAFGVTPGAYGRDGGDQARDPSGAPGDGRPAAQEATGARPAPAG